VVDLERDHSIKKEDLLYQCEGSPVEGTTFKGQVEKTLLNGQWVYENGKINPISAAKALTFDR
jgi:dihydroorotase-like cyclic amidohydrolase